MRSKISTPVACSIQEMVCSKLNNCYLLFELPDVHRSITCCRVEMVNYSKQYVSAKERTCSYLLLINSYRKLSNYDVVAKVWLPVGNLITLYMYFRDTERWSSDTEYLIRVPHTRILFLKKSYLF